jgi:hypothetical protein
LDALIMFVRKKAILYLTAIFVAGALAGGFCGFSLGRRAFFKPPKPAAMAKHLSDRLTAELKLAPEQVQKIDPILLETAAVLESLHENTGRQIAAVFRTNNQRIAVFLNPDQRRKLDELEKRHQGPPRAETNRVPHQQ